MNLALVGTLPLTLDDEDLESQSDSNDHDDSESDTNQQPSPFPQVPPAMEIGGTEDRSPFTQDQSLSEIREVEDLEVPPNAGGIRLPRHSRRARQVSGQELAVGIDAVSSNPKKKARK